MWILRLRAKSGRCAQEDSRKNFGDKNRVAIVCFDQSGVRVPFVAISPFSKPSYVSHTVGDHTSILALIEQVFMTPAGGGDDDDDAAARPHLTKRDQHASTLEDMFDFERSPLLNTSIGQALPPANDCTPVR